MQEKAFIDAILTEPDDHVSRLAFADWLSERDDPREAFVRAQGELGPSIHTRAGGKMVPIPAGGFTMGSPDDEPFRDPDERAHPVELTRHFYLGAGPVTVGEFRKFHLDTHYQTAALRSIGLGWNAAAGRWEHRSSYFWANPGWEQGDDEPAVCLAWDDAVAYCRWLSDADGREYRLPTEAEWEYACRAGTTTPFNFGADLLPAQANYDHRYRYAMGVTGGDGPGRTTPVGKYPANAFGLYDMHGNAWEWCSDWYDMTHFDTTRRRRDPPGARAGRDRVLRGGAWCVGARDCRSALRRCGDPSASRYLE
jgi:uncharacterized protein (TIGR02996 family)